MSGQWVSFFTRCCMATDLSETTKTKIRSSKSRSSWNPQRWYFHRSRWYLSLAGHLFRNAWPMTKVKDGTSTRHTSQPTLWKTEVKWGQIAFRPLRASPCKNWEDRAKAGKSWAPPGPRRVEIFKYFDIYISIYISPTRRPGANTGWV